MEREKEWQSYRNQNHPKRWSGGEEHMLVGSENEGKEVSEANGRMSSHRKECLPCQMLE